MTGLIGEVVLQLRRVPSGDMQVQHLPALHWPLGGVVQAKERSVACGQEEGVRQVGHVQGGLT